MSREETGLRLARFAMGTRFEAVLPGGDTPRLRAAGEAALEEVALLDAALDRFRKDSFLTFLNARAGEGPVRLDTDLYRLFVLCRRVHRRSGGAFDVTLGPLMEAWGFHTGGAAEGEAPGEALRRTGFRHVALDGKERTVRFLRPGLSLDFGAVAKGFALDRAAAVLREAGVERALLHGGTSTVTALGDAPGGGPWKVGLRDPRRTGDALLGTVCLRDRALSLSAPHGRVLEREGRRIGHVLDPATGRPAEGAALCAVVARSAGRADAWSTALLAAGPDRFEDLAAAARGITALLLEANGPGGGTLRRFGPQRDLFSISWPPEPAPGMVTEADRP